MQANTFSQVRRDGRCQLKVQISCPRRPCHKVDQKHGKRYGLKGVRQYCAQTGLGGWFFRVEETGTVQTGDKLVLIQRPHPEWSLDRVSRIMYTGATVKYEIPKWQGTLEELRELRRMEDLAFLEWREVLDKVAKRVDPLETRWFMTQNTQRWILVALVFAVVCSVILKP